MASFGAKNPYFCKVKEKIAPVIAMENEVISQMPPDETDFLLRLTAKYLDCLRSQSSQLFNTVQKKD